MHKGTIIFPEKWHIHAQKRKKAPAVTSLSRRGAFNEKDLLTLF